MCKDQPCLNCLTEKIDSIILSVDRISEKLDKLDKIVCNYDGLCARINYIDIVISKVSWILGVLFVAVTSIFLKIIFKV